MRIGQVVYTVALTLIVLVSILIVGIPWLATNSEDRQAVLALGSSALGVLVTLGSQAFFAGRRGGNGDANSRTDGQP